MKLKTIFYLFAILTGLCACKKVVDLPPAVAHVTNLNIINTSVDTINFYLNGTRQNNTSSIYAGGYTGYSSITSGIQNYDFRKNGHPELLFSKTLALDTIPFTTTIDSVKLNGVNIQRNTSVRGYTFFVCGETADKAFLLKDSVVTYSKPAAVRLAQTAYATGPIDIAVNDTIYFSNATFKTVSQFKPIGTGLKVIKVYQSGTNIVSATQKITLLSSQAYTIYVRGAINGTGNSALTTGVFVNQ